MMTCVSLAAHAPTDTPILQPCVITETLGCNFIVKVATLLSNYKSLQLETLQELGLDHFDAWAQQLAETTQSLEMTPDGARFQLRSRFNRFTSIPEGSKHCRQVLDVKPASELNLARPKLKGGKPEIISVPASGQFKEYMRELSRRVEAIKARRVAPHVDNILKITSDGRKAALDIRLVKLDAPRPAQSKVMAIVGHFISDGKSAPSA